MKIKLFLTSCIIGLSMQNISAQSVDTIVNISPKTNDIIAEHEEFAEVPLYFKDLKEKDVLWSTMVWELIDLRQKFNYPLYFPVDTLNPNRKSLFDVLLKAIRNREITEIYEDDYFLDKISATSVEKRLVIIDTTILGFEQLNAGEAIDPANININKISGGNIASYRIKGIWFFNRLNGEMQYRMLGICPVGKSASDLEKDDDPYPLFWIWMPDARKILQKNKMYTGQNYSRRMTFDHIIIGRKFQSIIYREDNEYMDRTIDAYIKQNAFYQLVEAERIKQSIRNFELDLWE